MKPLGNGITVSGVKVRLGKHPCTVMFSGSLPAEMDSTRPPACSDFCTQRWAIICSIGFILEVESSDAVACIEF